MPDRVVRTTLIIDDHGAVRVVKGVGEESARSEHKLSQLDKSAKGLGKTFSGLKGMLAGGLGLVGAGGLAFGLSSVITKTKEVAEETEKFHSITGLGAQSSLKYSQALRARGLSSDNLIKAFGYLAKNVHTAEIQEEKFGKAQVRAVSKGKELTAELGKQAKAIKELGLTAAGFAGKGPEEKIQAITKAFEGLAAGEKKTRLERELFGRGGNQLSILLEKNSLSLNNTAAKVEKYFGTIKGGMHGQEELLEKQREAQLAWEGLQFQLGTKLTPVLIKVFEWFSKISVEVAKGKGVWGELRKVGEQIFGVFKEIWKTFEKLVGPSNALKLAVGGIVAVMVVGKVAAFAGAVKGIGLAFAGANPEVAIFAAALYGILKGFEKITGTPVFKTLAEDVGLLPKAPKYTYQHVGPPTVSPTAARVQATANLVRNPQLLEQELHYAQTHPGATASAAAREALKIDLHLDSIKAAEAMLHNPRAARLVAEATTRYAHGMAARGHG